MSSYQCTYNDQNEVVALQNPNKANWKQLSKNEKLSEPFIRDNADFLDWNAVSAGQALTLSMLIDLKDKVKWKKIADNPHLDDDLKLIACYKLDFKRLLKKEKDTLPLSFIEKYYRAWQDSNDFSECWAIISSQYQLSKDFIHHFRFLLNWAMLRKKQKHIETTFWYDYPLFFVIGKSKGYHTPSQPAFEALSEQDILDNIARMDWFRLCKSQQLSEAFIEQLIPLVGHSTSFWRNISAFQKLSEPFIVKYHAALYWDRLSVNNNKVLSEELLLRFANKDLNWSWISEHYHLSAETIEHLKDKLHWERLSCNEANCLTEAIIRKYEDRWHWPWIWSYQQLSEDFIRAYIHKVEWKYFWKSQVSVLSEQFLREYEEKVNWYMVARLGNVSEDFIREFEAKFDSVWDWLALFQCQYARLSEQFIKDFHHKVDWEDARTYQVDYEGNTNFIRRFIPYVNWNLIFGPSNARQPMQYDEPFLRDFQDKFSKLMWKQISKEQQLSETFMEDFQDQLDWKLLSQYQQLSEDFMRKFKERLNWKLIAKHQLILPSFRKEFQDLLPA